MKKQQRIKLVEVHWEDHWLSASDWSDRALADRRNYLIETSVGYLVYQDRTHLFLSPNRKRNGNGSARGVTCIIRSCIKKIHIIGWRSKS